MVAPHDESNDSQNKKIKEQEEYVFHKPDFSRSNRSMAKPICYTDEKNYEKNA